MPLLPRGAGAGGSGGGTTVWGYALTSASVTVTDADVANKYFDLPAGAADMTAGWLDRVALALNTDVQYCLSDYEVTTNEAGKYRRITWAGLGLEKDPPVKAGDKVWVFYHVPVSGAGAEGDEGSGGHEIIDEDGIAMPQEGKLQFLNASITDDPVLGMTVVDMADFDRPYKPEITSPADGAVDTPTLTRVTASAYKHPYDVPIAGSRWQIATDPGFAGTSLVMDKTQESAAYSIVVTEDDAGQAVLSPSTTYYVRVRYVDVRDRESRWSDAVSFSTAATAAENVILQPEVVTPVDAGWMPEKKLIAQLSQPVTLGTVAPDAMDLQVSMTKAFGSADIVKDYQDVADPTLLLDDDADFSAAPSPLYLRGRQKDSARNIVSPWSSAPTVWLQRAFKDLVVGIEHVVQGGNSVVYNIDKSGARVAVPSGYWNDHPLWGSMTTRGVPSPAGGVTNYVVRLPAFYVKVETDDNDDLDGIVKHRFWVSPTALDDDWYPHPAFRQSQGGLYLSQLASMGGTPNQAYSGNHEPPTAYDAGESASYATWTQLIAAADAGTNKIFMWNVHVRSALYLLMRIEKCIVNMYDVNSGVGGGHNNDAASVNYRGLYSLMNVGSNYQYCNGISVPSGVGPFSSTEPTSITLGLDVGSNVGAEEFVTFDPVVLEPNEPVANDESRSSVTKIMTGKNAMLGAHLELYGLPAQTKAGAGYYGRYYATVYQKSDHNTPAYSQAVADAHSPMYAGGNAHDAFGFTFIGNLSAANSQSFYTRFIILD
jgi:hypothetical protein